MIGACERYERGEMPRSCGAQLAVESHLVATITSCRQIELSFGQDSDWVSYL
jgi:hypothetical protein